MERPQKEIPRLPPRWIFPRTPPVQQRTISRVTLRTPQIIDTLNQDIQNELNPVINTNEQRLYREDIHNLSGLITPRTTRTTRSSIIALPPEISRNPLFTENDISQIRSGYNEPILTALEEIREFYNNSITDDDDTEGELINTTEMTGILSNLNDSVTNSPVSNDNNDVSNNVINDIFSNELTQALNNFIQDNTPNQQEITNVPTINTYTSNDTDSLPLIRNEFFYFYHDAEDLEPSTPPQPISPPSEPNYDIITDISVNDIDNSYNFYTLHDFL